MVRKYFLTWLPGEMSSFAWWFLFLLRSLINDYFFSNYYCDQVFDRCPNEKMINDIDGILFPSVSFSYQYYNLVLHPRCLVKIRFIEAMYVWVTYSKDTQDMNYYPLEQHVIADSAGRLMWNLFKQK